MKFSNRLLLFLAGVVLSFRTFTAFTNPAASLAGGLHLVLLVSSIAAITGYFSAPRASAHLFIFSRVC